MTNPSRIYTDTRNCVGPFISSLKDTYKLYINIIVVYASMWRMVFVYQQWISSSIAMFRIDFYIFFIILYYNIYILQGIDILIFHTRVYDVNYLE